MPRLVLALCIVLISGLSARAESPRAWTRQHLSELIELYRELHRNPELSFQEAETATRVAAELSKTGAEITRDVGGHGLVAILRNGEGPTLMLRTDLDGLPVAEQTNLVYASKARARDEQGNDVAVMHACGHDIHMTNLIGTAWYLAANREAWSGTLMLIGQPAEERGAGARSMLDDGLFQRFPRPDAALALHVVADLAAGKVACRAGYTAANVDSIDITMYGRGGHGAYPQTTIDPIVLAAHLVVDLQSIVSREIDPTESAVVTVGSIHGGTKHNVIGETCHLQLTVRSYTDEVRAHLLEAIERKARAVAVGARAKAPDVVVSEGTPALLNDDDLAALVTKVLRRELGDENVDVPVPTMGGEDFGRYGRAGVPIFMFGLGTVDASRLERFEQLGQPAPSLHSPRYYPDAELTLSTGITAMSHAALEILAPVK